MPETDHCLYLIIWWTFRQLHILSQFEEVPSVASQLLRERKACLFLTKYTVVKCVLEICAKIDGMPEKKYSICSSDGRFQHACELILPTTGWHWWTVSWDAKISDGRSRFYVSNELDKEAPNWRLFKKKISFRSKAERGEMHEMNHKRGGVMNHKKDTTRHGILWFVYYYTRYHCAEWRWCHLSPWCSILNFSSLVADISIIDLSLSSLLALYL